MSYRLLEAFEATFNGRPYYHRNQTIGNFIASHLFEDLVVLGRSAPLVEGVRSNRLVVNTLNVVKGRRGRRGDGTFGELIPGEEPKPETGFQVLRGPVATILIGAEVKILAKSMIKQIDRVINDLVSQARTFREQTSSALTIGIVGVNFSTSYTSYEGEREYPADPAPVREASATVERITNSRVPKDFDELLFMKFKATNIPPYPFEWHNHRESAQEYASALLRISNLFAQRGHGR